MKRYIHKTATTIGVFLSLFSLGTARAEEKPSAPSEDRMAVMEREIASLKEEMAALKGAEIPKLTKEQQAEIDRLKQEISADAEKLAAFDKAVAGGLDPKLVEKNIKTLQQDIEDKNAAVAAIEATLTAPKDEPKAAPVQPEPAAAALPLEPKAEEVPFAGYDKGFFIQSKEGDFLLKANGLLQTRFAFSGVDDGTELEPAFAFSMNRAEIKLSGNAFSPRFQYAFQLEFGKGQAVIKDAYVDFEISKKWLVIRAGQWKRPYSRQGLMADTSLEFTDRDEAVKDFAADRDIGVGLHNHFLKSPIFEYAIGLFNGTGYAPWMKGEAEVETDDEGNSTVDLTKCCGFTNVPKRFNPTLVARLGFNLGDIKGYSEADLEGGGPRFAMAASSHMEFDGDDDDVSRLRAEVDYIFKAYGFATEGAVYIASRGDGSFANQDFEAVGYHFQLGHVFASLFEPAVRYAATLPDDESGEAGIHRLLFGANFYFKKHNLKWQTDGGPTFHVSNGDTLIDATIRTQVQLTF